jgi:aryl-alcohol dehydrogenase-like predicted oxidoreductase
MDPRLIGYIESSPMGFGGWAIGGPFTAGGQPAGWGEVDDQESIAAIRAAFDAGITLFDTANVYGTGHSERILAQALEGHRNQVVVATKWGNTMQEDTRILDGSDGSATAMRRSLEGSLRRLDTDYVDLFQFHLNDFDGPGVWELQEALEEVAAQGKIRAYGWSTDFPDRAHQWIGGRHFWAIQAEINVLNDNPGIFELAEDNELACLNRGPLAMGLLSGKYTSSTLVGPDDVRRANPEWLRYFHNGRPSPEFLSMLDSVREALTCDGRSLVQGALAWLWGRSRTAIPIPGIRTVAQAEENAAAMEFGPLPPAAMEEIENLLRSDSDETFELRASRGSQPPG